MAARIALPVVTDVESDAIITGHMPIFGGQDEEDLVCGACGEVLARNTSTHTLYHRTATAKGRLILKCACGAHNAIAVIQGDGPSNKR